MNASDGREQRVGERLHAEAQTVDACFAQSFEKFCVDRAGIRLDRELFRARQTKTLAHGADDGEKVVCRKRRRRAAADVDGAHCPCLQTATALHRNLAAQGFSVVAHPSLFSCV